MKRIFQLLLFFWILSILSPENNAMEANRTCVVPKNNISQFCQFVVAESSEIQTYCNSSLLPAICNACNYTGNLSCIPKLLRNNSTSNEGKWKSTPLVAQLVFYGIIFIVGVVGNLLIILTVTSKRMRSVRSMLLGNLAIADLTTLCFCLPITIINMLAPWPFGTFMCRYIFPLTDVLVSVSILTISVITMDRFRAIVYPFARKMSLKVTLSVIVAVWVFSYMVVALPLLSAMKIGVVPSGRKACYQQWGSKLNAKVYRLVILIVLYVIPVALMFFSFICIAKKIKENIRFTKETVRDKHSLARIRRRSRVVKIMFAIFITFAICLFPIHLLLTISTFHPQVRSWKPYVQVAHAATVVLTANSAMNPIILYMLSSEFKRGFQEHCLCFFLFVKAKGGNETSISMPSRSFNNQQLTTCLHLPSEQQEANETRGSVKKSHQQKELLGEQNGNHQFENENVGGKGNEVETML